MRLRILRGRSARKLTRARWRGRSRRFTIVQSAVEALWNQGFALRMSLPEQSGDDDRSRATLGQWRSYVGVFLSENVRRERVPDEFDVADRPEDGDTCTPRVEEQGAADVYDTCLEALAVAAHELDDADVLAAPLPLYAAAESSGCALERLLAIKVRGIPRIG